MSKKWSYGKWVMARANDNTALIPEVWAQEALLFLENNMVAAQLVHRDFENKIASYGDVVNAHRPAGFEAKRKVDGDDVTVQDATVTKVPVKLDQHWHTSFIIYDGEESKAMTSLMDYHARPAMSSIAQAIDQVVLGQAYEFMGTTSGKLGTAATKASIIAARGGMTNNKAPLTGRVFLINPDTEGDLLNIDDFVNANTVGDNGSALREGHIGRKHGFDFFVSQNVPTIASGNTVVAGAINNGNVAAGSTVLTVDGFTGAPARILGSWCTIGKDMTPQRITGSGNNTGGDLIQITVSPGLRYATEDDEVVTIYTPGSINLGGGYASGWAKPLVTNNFSVAPKSGQLVSFGTAADVYGAVGTPTTTSLSVNRSLDALLNDTANVNIGPAGSYNFAFHRDAVALVSRPLAKPQGVSSAVVNYNGLSIRATITYEGRAQGHLVTLDLLTGVKTLDTNLGAVMFA